MDRNPMPGVEVWINPKNKFMVFQCHWTADIDKREGYIDGIKASMPTQKFNQEFEIQWETFIGKPVYQDWKKNLHSTNETLIPYNGLPLLIGIDQGLQPACIVAQYVNDQLLVLREYTESNMSGDRFAQKIKSDLMQRYPAWDRWDTDYIVWMDPASFNRKDTDATTYAKCFADAGFKPMPGAMTWEERKSSVEEFLTTHTKNGPGILVSRPNCKMIVQGFDGGFRYPESAFEIEPNKIRPLKDEHSHPHDALQYLCSGLLRKKRGTKVNIPLPQYAWSKKNGKVQSR